MSTPVTVEQIVNQALDRVGWPEYIGNIYEGTKQARVALNIYAQTRDALLRDSDWGFAEKIAAASLAVQAAPSPWSVQYLYPPDCIRIRNMFNAAYLSDKNNPLPVLYTIYENATDGKTILTNAAGATLVYTAQIVDMDQWEPLFVEALIASLGRRLAPALAGIDAAKAESEDEKIAITIAAGIVG